jgi:hypothetical protein
MVIPFSPTCVRPFREALQSLYAMQALPMQRQNTTSMQLLQADVGAVRSADAADGAEAGSALSPRTPALPQRATSRQMDPMLGSPQNLPLLPAVQVDRLAFEQLARLSRLGRLPAAVLSAANAQANALELQWQQPHAYNASTAQADASCAAWQHNPSLVHSPQREWTSRLQPVDTRANWHRNWHPVPCRQRGDGRTMTYGPVARQHHSIWQSGPATWASRTAAERPNTLQPTAASPGDSRVRQALRTLHPEVHTIGDLAAIAGAAALAQVILDSVTTRAHASMPIHKLSSLHA